jgi:hypothetical protein
MATSDLNIILAELFSPPERISEVCRGGIFQTPLNSFEETAWMRVRPARSLFTPSLLSNIENVV